MDIEALSATGLLDSEIFLGRRPAADRPRRMRRMHSVHKHHGFVRAKRVEKILVGFDEGFLLESVGNFV